MNPSEFDTYDVQLNLFQAELEQLRNFSASFALRCYVEETWLIFIVSTLHLIKNFLQYFNSCSALKLY